MTSHIVLFTPRADIDEAGRQAFIAALKAACHDIPTIRRVVVGQRLTLGVAYEQAGLPTYEYAAVFEFDSADDLKAYLAHEAHQMLGQMFWTTAERVLIMDTAWMPELSVTDRQ